MIVKKNIFKELSNRYQAFCRNLAGRPIKTPVKSAEIKAETPKSKTKHHSAYKPSGKEYINDYNWRRWVRVKEWFHEFGPNAEKSERNILIQ